MIYGRNWHIRFLPQILHGSNLGLYLEPGHEPAGNACYELLVIDKSDEVGLGATEERSEHICRRFVNEFDQYLVKGSCKR